MHSRLSIFISSMAGFAANLSRGEDEQRVEQRVEQVVHRPRLTAPGGGC